MSYFAQFELPIGIWGLGREGISVSKFLTGVGHRVIAVDEQKSGRPEGLNQAAQFFFGSNALEQLLSCGQVVTSPGVPRVHPFRKQLESYGIVVTTGTNLWMRIHSQDMIGVTGTKGKSTTASLVHFLLNAGGVPTELGGNIGVPLTEITDLSAVTVAEMSSYQCAYLERSPRIAVITNLFQDHLPWHGSLAQYWLDKSNIFTRGAEVLICSSTTLEILKTLGVVFPSIVRTTDDELLSQLDPDLLPASLSAPHNIQNLKLAILAAAAVPGFKLNIKSTIEMIQNFKGLPHRLQVIAEHDGRVWVDDSLSTTPESVVAAVQSFTGRELILIVGGLDRGIDYQLLTLTLASRLPTVHVLCLPDNGLRMMAPYQALKPQFVHPVGSMAEAVELSSALSHPGTVIVMTPGAPSYNAYQNFEEKSHDFVQSVLSLGSSFKLC